MNFRTRIGLWAPVVGFMTLLFAFSSQPGVGGPDWVWDKLAHALAYGALGLLCLRALHEGLDRPRPRPTLLAMLITVGYGVLDELHQATVPGRDASVLDAFADATGAGLSIPLFGLLAVTAAAALGGRTRKEES